MLLRTLTPTQVNVNLKELIKKTDKRQPISNFLADHNAAESFSLIKRENFLAIDEQRNSLCWFLPHAIPVSLGLEIGAEIHTFMNAYPPNLIHATFDSKKDNRTPAYDDGVERTKGTYHLGMDYCFNS